MRRSPLLVLLVLLVAPATAGATDVAPATAGATDVAPATAGARDVPPGFLWGFSSAGFQHEMGGSPAHADTGSDWWRWTHDPVNLRTGIVTRDRPERGPGTWSAYREDARLARGLGANAFRLSIEWSRIFPRSTRGARTLAQLDRLANHRALAHYAAMLRALRARGLTPFVTVSHFSLPRWIHDPIATRAAFAGVGPDDPLPPLTRPAGWLDPATIGEFRKYAGYLAWKLGALVRFWTPINEPLVLAANGYVNVPGAFGSSWPPGVFSYTAAVRAIENMVLGNAAAYDAIHARDREARVGLVQNVIAFTGPAEAARHADDVFNRLFLDAAVRGVLDRNVDGAITPAERVPRLRGKADFIGLDYYFRGRVTQLPAPLSRRIGLLDFVPTTGYRSVAFPDGPPCPTTCSDLGSELYPEGLRGLLRMAGSYGRPVYITENGIADRTDRLRRRYIPAQLRVLRRAIADRVADVRGYFHWSLVDNFEWVEGFAPKFGLYAYDPRTLKRRARPSARLLARIYRTGRLPR